MHAHAEKKSLHGVCVEEEGEVSCPTQVLSLLWPNLYGFPSDPVFLGLLSLWQRWDGAGHPCVMMVEVCWLQEPWCCWSFSA